MTASRDQFYTFPLPETNQIWTELFLADGTHMVAPTPYSGTEMALAEIRRRNPGAIVDELCMALDIDKGLRVGPYDAARADPSLNHVTQPPPYSHTGARCTACTLLWGQGRPPDCTFIQHRSE